jgi:hypothetical protein
MVTLVNLLRNNERFMKYFFTLIAVLIISTNSFSQTQKYFDAPFGGGGGFIPAWYVPNVDPLNLKLQEIGIPELSKNGLFTTGGAGFIYIGFVKNLRIGGMGFGGSMSESVSKLGTDYEAIYSIGGGGLTVEYTLPFIKNIGVSLGAVIGGGSIIIETFQNTSGFSWENLTNQSSTNSFTRLTNNYWLFSPTLNIEIPLYRFIALRLGAGYQFTFGNSWEVNNNQTISGVPDDLNGDAFFIQAGIFAGFFSF